MHLLFFYASFIHILSYFFSEETTIITMITDHVNFGYARDPFVYGSLALALGFGTVYYFNRFSIWKTIKTLGIKCILSKNKLFHTVFGVFLIFLNIYVWVY